MGINKGNAKMLTLLTMGIAMAGVAGDFPKYDSGNARQGPGGHGIGGHSRNRKTPRSVIKARRRATRCSRRANR